MTTTLLDCAIMLAEAKSGLKVETICSNRQQRQRGIHQAALWVWIARRFGELVGHVPVNQLHPGLLVKFITVEKQQGRQPKTIRNHVAILRRLWRFAYTLQLTTQPPPELDLDALVPLFRRCCTAWTTEDLRAVLEVIESRSAYPLRGRFARIGGVAAVDWWRALVLFLYHTAMRVGSALDLTPADYVWDGNGSALVCVREAKTQRQEWRQYTVPDRAVALPQLTESSDPQLWLWSDVV